MNQLMQAIAALFAGFLLGAGLLISGMTDPGKVLGFLDVLGTWNPALMGVLGGAVMVSVLGFQHVRKMVRPWFDTQFNLTARSDIDKPLILGGALFGMGWGLVGYCPGPALAGLALGNGEALIFVMAMIAGGLAQGAWARRASSA